VSVPPTSRACQSCSFAGSSGENPEKSLLVFVISFIVCQSNDYFNEVGIAAFSGGTKVAKLSKTSPPVSRKPQSYREHFERLFPLS